MNIEDLLINSTTAKRHYSANQIITALDGGGGGGSGGTSRTSQTASYFTASASPTVFYTAVHPDGSPLQSRTSSGVIFANGLYTYVQNTIGITDYVAVWDEGNPAVFTVEWIVVDQA